MTDRRMTPLRRKRLYQSLAAHISDFIEAQGLSPGDRLPPERELAAELGVSRATLAQALAALETRGQIEVRHGVGTVVLEPSGPRDTAQALALDTRDRGEVYAAREAILAGLARAAASNRHTSVKVALLADDGTARRFEHTWQMIRNLADSPLLADLDDMLSETARAAADSAQLRSSLDSIAAAILDNDPTTAAALCSGILTDHQGV